MRQHPIRWRAWSLALVALTMVAGCKAPPPRSPKILGSTRAPAGMQAPPINNRTPVLVPTAPVASPRPVVAALAVPATAVAVPTQPAVVAVPGSPAPTIVQGQPVQGQVQGQMQLVPSQAPGAGNLPPRPDDRFRTIAPGPNGLPSPDPQRLELPPEP
jgi:hypothetical protein